MTTEIIKGAIAIAIVGGAIVAAIMGRQDALTLLVPLTTAVLGYYFKSVERPIANKIRSIRTKK